MDKKNNMKQAMYEMFGVGAEQSVREGEEMIEDKGIGKAEQPAASNEAASKKTRTAAAPKNSTTATYFAPGTVFEGNLRSIGDIEIAGDFKGDIITEGVVTLCAGVQGNITAKSLNVSDCNLIGDVVVSEHLVVNEGASISGNISAKELHCAGHITGDMKVSDNTSLEGSSKVIGNITTGGISVIRGAIISGGIDIKPGVVSKD